MPLGSLTEPVTFPLRLLVSKIVAFVCTDILGISVIASGTQLFNGMGTYQYEVAAACSGIRSMVAIAVLAIIYAFVVFPSGWQRVVLIASAAPLALIGNTFRMLIIVLPLSSAEDRRQGRRHTIIGSGACCPMFRRWPACS